MKNTLLLVIMAMLVSGCILTKDYINIEYIPETGISEIDGANSIRISVKSTDMRTIKDKVSSKKHGGHGRETAAIISNKDVATLITNTIEDEVRNRGFKIAEGDVHIGIELNKFYNDFKTGVWSWYAVSDLIMNVQVKESNGNINYTKSITESYIETGITLCLGKNAKMALEEVLKNTISKLMHDPSFIAALLKERSN